MRTARIILAMLPLSAAALLLARPGGVLHAQTTVRPITPAAGQETATCSAGFSLWLSSPRLIQLTKGVQFAQDDTTLDTEAAVATLGKDQDLISAKAQGSVHIYDEQDDLVGQHGSIDFTKHLATLQDGIVLHVKPGKREASAAEGSPRRQFKDPATLTCAMMTYDYRFKVGRIPGLLTVTQVVQTKEDGPQTRTLTAEAGLYNGKAETIQLVGTIKCSNSDGSIMEGDTRLLGKPLVISLKEGSESILLPFKSIAHLTVKPEAKNSKDDASSDEEPDLTMPVPPPHIPAPGETPAPASSAPTPAVQAPTVKTPAVPAQTPAAPVASTPQTSTPTAAPTGSP